MNKLGLSLALLALSGCASTKDFVTRHPVITTIALTSAAFIAVGLMKGHNRDSGTDGRDYTIQPVICGEVNCK